LLLASMALSCAFATDQDTFAPTPTGMAESSPALEGSAKNIASGNGALGDDVPESMETPTATVEAAAFSQGCKLACKICLRLAGGPAYRHFQAWCLTGSAKNFVSGKSALGDDVPERMETPTATVEAAAWNPVCRLTCQTCMRVAGGLAYRNFQKRC